MSASCKVEADPIIRRKHQTINVTIIQDMIMTAVNLDILLCRAIKKNIIMLIVQKWLGEYGNPNKKVTENVGAKVKNTSK